MSTGDPVCPHPPTTAEIIHQALHEYGDALLACDPDPEKFCVEVANRAAKEIEKGRER